MKLSRKRITRYVILFFVICAVAFVSVKIKRHFSRGNDQIVFSEIKQKNYSSTVFLHSDFYNIEDEDPAKNASISIEKSVSGTKSTKLSSSVEYGYTILKKIKSIPSYEQLRSIQVELKCWMGSDVDDDLANYVLSIDDTTGKNISWAFKPIATSKKDEWTTVRMNFGVKPEALNPEYIIKLYPWNKEKKDFYIDDITITYNGAQSMDSLIKVIPKTNFFYDFESTEGLYKTADIKEGIAHSGNYSCDLSYGGGYSAAVIKQLGEVGPEPIKNISVSVWVYPLTDKTTVLLEASAVTPKGENIYWYGKKVESEFLPKKKWTKINALIVLPFEELSLNDFIVVDVWNRGNTGIMVDDLEVVYGDEAERKGEYSQMDPNFIYQKKFTAQTNKHPFVPMFLHKKDLKNNNSTFIIDNGTNKTGDFAPGDYYTAGNFCADAFHLDEVMHITKNDAGLYTYCPEASKFIKLWQGTKSDRNNLLFDIGAKRITGDFDNNGSSDLLVINTKNSGQLFSFSGIVDCKENQVTLTSLWNAAGPVFENRDLNEKSLFFAGDFNDDKKTELLVINAKNGSWSLYLFDKDKWHVMAASTESTNLDPSLFNPITTSQISGRFFSGKNLDVLLTSVFNKETEKAGYYSFVFNSAQKRFDVKSLGNEISGETFFKVSDHVFSGNFDNDAEQEFLDFNTDWRFDLKLVNADPNGFTISNTIEFKGYPQDHNPKYYEFVKIVSGNFISADRSSLLLLMRNCMDSNFNGKECKQYENLDYLPNSTQLYFIEN